MSEWDTQREAIARRLEATVRLVTGGVALLAPTVCVQAPLLLAPYATPNRTRTHEPIHTILHTITQPTLETRHSLLRLLPGKESDVSICPSPSDRSPSSAV